MLCPHCSELLKPRISHGVEVDVCMGCGGVWLDRGELEKLLFVNEPAVLATSASSSVQDGDQVATPPPPKPPESKKGSKSNADKKSKKKSKKKRKRDWADQLEDIFEDVLDWD